MKRFLSSLLGSSRKSPRPSPARLNRGPVPDHLQEWWDQDRPWLLHSAAWWRRHWGRTGILDVTLSDALPEGWRLWVDWLGLIAPENVMEIQALEADSGRYLGYVRTVGHRRAEAPLQEPIVSVPTQYSRKPLLRGEGEG